MISAPALVAQDRFQLALAAWPGIGAQAGYIRPHTIYTLESVIYAEAQPRQRRSTLVVSGGVGAALRPLGVLRAIGQADYGFDVDLGVRFGPSLLFTAEATRADKNRQFSLFIDPFIRFSSRFSRGRIYFVEMGPLRPTLRVGLWFGADDSL